MCLTKDYDVKHRDKVKNRKEALRLYGRVDKKDKIVYKSFYQDQDTNYPTRELHSPYTDFSWPKNGHVIVPSLGVRVGVNQLAVNKGLHACLKLVHAKQEPGNVVEKMIIPAGTQYIVGNIGDIVTTEMWLKSDYDKYKRSKRRNTTTSKKRVPKISKKKHNSLTNRKRKK